MQPILSFLVSIACAAGTLAHGQVKAVYADGQYNAGPNIYWDGDSANSQTAIRKMYKSSGPAYLLPQDFSNNWKMSCEEAGPAPNTIKVNAGSAVTVEWEGATGELIGLGGLRAYNPWVHAMGPIMDYITSCGDQGCSSFDATNAGWTKLAEYGLDGSRWIDDTLRNAMTNKPEKYYPEGAGVWGMAELVNAGSKWNIAVPSSLRSGQYILRHELAAVHNPKRDGDDTTGPQLYTACIQIEVTNGGDSDLPKGTQSGQLYDPNGDFAWYNVYSNSDPSAFKVPGPSVWNPNGNSKREAKPVFQAFNATASSRMRRHKRVQHNLKH